MEHAEYIQQSFNEDYCFLHFNWTNIIVQLIFLLFKQYYYNNRNMNLDGSKVLTNAYATIRSFYKKIIIQARNINYSALPNKSNPVVTL